MPFQCFGVAIVHGLSTCSWSTDPVLLRLSLTDLDHCQDQEMDPQQVLPCGLPESFDSG